MGPINVIIIVVGLFYFGVLFFGYGCSISEKLKGRSDHKAMVQLQGRAGHEAWKRQDTKVASLKEHALGVVSELPQREIQHG